MPPLHASRACPSWREGGFGAARAFTLAELLIAIGILGVCLSLGATLFPLAIKTHEESMRNTAGLLVCENAMTVAKAVLSSGCVVDDTNTDVQWISRYNGQLAAPIYQPPDGLSNFAFCYPALTLTDTVENSDWQDNGHGTMVPRTLEGAMVFARRIADDTNDFQIIAVSYKKADATHGVWAELVNGATVSQDQDGGSATVTVPAGQEAFLKKGGAVIIAHSTTVVGTETNVYAGSYAIIASVDGLDATMRTPFFQTTTNASESGDDIYVVWEGSDATDISAMMIPGHNPVVAVMSTRTGLK